MRRAKVQISLLAKKTLHPLGVTSKRTHSNKKLKMSAAQHTGGDGVDTRLVQSFRKSGIVGRTSSYVRRQFLHHLKSHRGVQQKVAPLSLDDQIITSAVNANHFASSISAARTDRPSQTRTCTHGFVCTCTYFCR